MTESAIQQQLRFSAALNQLAESTIAGESPTQLLQAMARIAGTAVHVDRTLVYDVRVNEGRTVGLAEWLTSEKPGIASTIGVYPLSLFGDSVSEVMTSHRWIESHRDALHQSIGSVGLDLLHGKMGVASLLWFPFRFKENGFQLLVFHQLEPRRWQADELAFVEAAARLVNLALVKIGLMAETHRALEALEASEARFRALYDETPSMFFTVGEDGKFSSLNHFALEQLGWSAEELIGHDALTVFVPEDREIIRVQLAECFEHEGRVFRWEARKRRKDGTVITVREIARSVRRADGRQETLIVCDDITEAKRVEQAVLQTQKLETVGVLVSGIAHDFNNLLGAVVGNAELALLKIPHDSPARELVEQAALAGTRSAELVKQLLSYSAKAPFTRQRVDLNGLIREMAGLLDATAGKRARIMLALQPGPLWVITDPTQLRQVLMNLIHNAADSMEGRSGSVTVKTSVTRFEGDQEKELLPPGDYVRTEVVDLGSGIEAGHLERIFDPFFTTKVSGRGLGLSAVRTIAHRHGGGVFVTSKPGVGSTFTVLLPVAPTEPLELHSTLPSVSEPHLPTGATVLVVDDDVSLQRVLAHVLEELGLVPLLASQAADAQLLVQQHPELRCALVDLTLRGGGGPSFVRELHATRPDVPVLLMSGFAEPEASPNALRETVGFLAKPFTPHALREALGRAFHRNGGS